MTTIFIQRITRKSAGHKPPLPSELTFEIDGEDERGDPVRIVLKKEDAESLERFITDTRDPECWH